MPLFVTLNHKVLKLDKPRDVYYSGLRHIINYKVLKRYVINDHQPVCLRHIINYKVLKHSLRQLEYLPV